VEWRRAVGLRWALWIDIEGFGALYDRETLVLEALGDLMDGILLIGERCYSETPDRLFAHQTGDGFVIVSEFGASSLEVPTAIAIALLRHVAACGRFAKASIGEGEFADILGCYPQRIREACVGDSTVRLGGGLMTLFPVMGTALIDAIGVAKRSPSGALLTVARSNRRRLPIECVVREPNARDIVSIDWVHSDLPLVAHLQNTAGLSRPSPGAIRETIMRYSDQLGPSEQWVANTLSLLGLAGDVNERT
jgi:hypothetical protein